ncbi:MAG: toll/interleukin-1 receptor domain-containing protein [Saprospiraceae bacterium]
MLVTKGYRVLCDKTTVTYRDNIEQFMRAIGAGKYVLAVVSNKYLRSAYCMFEAMRMLAYERFEERVFPVVLSKTPTACIATKKCPTYT